MNKTKIKEAEVTKVVILILLVFVIFLLSMADHTSDYRVNFGVGKVFVYLDKRHSNYTMRSSYRHYRHGRRNYHKRDIIGKNQTKTNMEKKQPVVDKANEYTKVKLIDIFSDKNYYV